MTDTHSRTPGWYRDPGRPSEHRYWNGESWVGQVGEPSRLPRQAAPQDTADQSTDTLSAGTAVVVGAVVSGAETSPSTL